MVGIRNGYLFDWGNFSELRRISSLLSISSSRYLNPVNHAFLYLSSSFFARLQLSLAHNPSLREDKRTTSSATNRPKCRLSGFNEEIPMLKHTMKPRKVSFSEEDAATLIQRYEASTVLTLLQEVALYPDGKIDWNELVKKTSTGISNAREYQMLWRHLAYRHALPEKSEDGADPLDDDSDLECELEALPPVTGESTSEAAACVKVMIASGTLSESTPSSSTIEAPLTINLPVSQSSVTSKENSQPFPNMMQGPSIIFPVTVLRQTAPNVSSAEGVEASGLASGNMNSKRKRKAWSEEEDKQLRAAVERCGEGNWVTISKEDNFSFKRRPAQLAQRWTVLRKKGGNANSVTNPPSSQFTAEQLATRHSLSLALDMPFNKLAAAGTTDPARTSVNASAKNPVQPGNAAETPTIRSSSISAQHSSQQSLRGPSAYPAKCKVVSEKTVPKSNLSPDSAVRATAVAAGARIVSSSDTVSQLKAAQARNAVHFMPTCNSPMKSSIPPGSSTHPKAHSVVSSSSAVAVASPAACTSAVKAASQAVENHPKTMSNILSQQQNRASSVANEVPLRQEVHPKLFSHAASEVPLKQLNPNPVSSVAKEVVPVKQEINPNHVSSVANEVPLKQEVNPNLVSTVAKPEVNPTLVSIVANEIPSKSEVNPNHVSSLASEVLLKQVNPTEVSSLVPKERIEDTTASSLTEKTPSEDIQEEKAVCQNPREDKIQGAVVMNHDGPVDGSLEKERQDSNHTKTMDLPVNNAGHYHSSDNGSSEDQQASSQNVLQIDCGQSLELPS
ncbi:hypothetical protein L6164_030681 [Bauhinia variegata]|uniref:Uncharacterized protein n=2 Tax=Bauhinia variegata TaxID=167791 RepID=A0ACB9LD60_BAUVA|nr:hypothetical protein L6164_030681 [Bauhinia variegata]